MDSHDALSADESPLVASLVDLGWPADAYPPAPPGM